MCSVKLLHQNSQDDAISILFAMMSGTDSDVGIESYNPFRNVGSRKHSGMMPDIAIVTVFILYIFFESSTQIDLLSPSSWHGFMTPVVT
jgi:hypothetical protein